MENIFQIQVVQHLSKITMKFKKAFTLIEVMTVVIVVGILVTLAAPGLSRMKERTQERIGKATLSMIADAERSYRLKNDTRQYIGCNDIDDCQETLEMDLGNGLEWDYRVIIGDPTLGNVAQADRIAGSLDDRTISKNLDSGVLSCAGTDCFF